MAALSHSESKRKYSWWWDSHISPKNSKWLQENLTDMDIKVKQMIKLIEEDADSFARRAEMYYKKRPELMKLVEEFYRAYRALAERYDHATGVIRQAHHTIAEAFPNQVPPVLTDELPPSVSSIETEPMTPLHSHAFHDTDESQKDASTHIHAIRRNGAFTDESDSAISRKGLKQLNDLFMSGENVSHARRGLNFLDADGLNNGRHDDTKAAQMLSESERMTRAETEILALKKALAKLESEKEAGLLQYQQSMERLTNLESEVCCARENSQGLDERASKAEAEVETLKESLTEIQAEREASLLQYQQCLEKISNLENNISSAHKDVIQLNERAMRAETDAESLKQELAGVEAQKESVLVQYNHTLETLAQLEERLVQAEENARKINEQADMAKSEIDAMKLEIEKLTEEKEDAALRYQQCLEIISSLEHKLACAEDKVRQLNCKIDDEVEKLHSSEQKCLLLETTNQTLRSELQDLTQRMGSQSEQLSEKQKELGKLWTCLQEERLRFIETETAFQTLQNLHSQSKEELRSLAIELHNKAEVLENMESCKQALEDEVDMVKDKNKILNELKFSSSLSIKNLQDEILNLRETIEKLEMEVGLRVDERNSLQQEIYSLKEKLSVVNERHEAMMEEVRSTGLDPQCFSSSVKKLQDENSKLKETCEANDVEKADLLEKVEIVEKLLERNVVLEISISNLNAELESIRGKVKVLEDTCQSLLGEKETLISQLSITHQTMKDLEMRRGELELQHLDLKSERESALRKVEELLVALYAEREEHSTVVQLNEGNLAEKEFQIHILQEDANHWEREYNEEIDRTVHAQMEIFILQKYIQDLEQKNFSLAVECRRLLEASKMSDTLVSELENDNVQKQGEVNLLSEKIKTLRNELFQVFKTLDINSENWCVDMIEEDQELLKQMHDKLQETQNSSIAIFNESQQVAIENSVLVTFLRQLKLNAESLVTERGTLDEEFRTQSKQFLALQAEFEKIVEKNQELKSKMSKGEEKMQVMKAQIENLCKQVSDLEEAHRNMQEESYNTFEEKSSLMRRFIDLGEEKSNLEEEVCMMIQEIIAQSNTSLIYQNIIFEKLLALRELSEDLDKLGSVNTNLEERLKIMVAILEDVQMENLQLKESFVVSNMELQLAESVNDQLNCQVRNGKELLSQAADMFSALHDEKTELQRLVEDLKSKYDEARVKLEDQASHISKLSSDKDGQNEELGCLYEVNQKLEDEKRHLHQELGESKLRGEKLSCELRKGAKEIEQQKTQATSIFSRLQTSAVTETLLKGKVRELANANENLECRSMGSEQLKERVYELEGENGRLRGQLAAYVPVVRALNECITSLEMQTLVHAKHQDYKESKVKHYNQHNEGGLQISQDQDAPAPDALSDFQDMQKRINAIEMAVKQMNESSKPKDEMRVIQVLKSGTSWRQGKVQASKHVIMDEKEYQSGNADEQKKTGKSMPDIPLPEIEVLPKDIMLDQMTESSSSYGRSRRGTRESDEQMLELWETANKDGSIGLKVSTAPKTATAPVGYHQRRATRESRKKYPSIESLVEKELGVDMLKSPRRLTQPHHEEGNRRKILERLDSDAQKLVNLEITLHDLMSRVEITEKSTSGRSVEYDEVKRHLQDAQESIIKLFDANRKLLKTVEEGSALSFAGNSPMNSDESGSAGRRRVSQQARRGSEKIGRLQLEVQRLQFLLLKLNDERESKGKTRIDDQNPRVLLKDYLYGQTTRIKFQRKKKKPTFCACVHPPTKED